MIFKNKKWLLGSLACIAMMGAQAQSQTQMQAQGLSGFYVGGNIGSTTITDLGSKIGFGGFAGYNFNENIAAEVGAQSLGTFTFDGTDINTSAYNVSILVGVPIDPKFSFYGRLGYGGLKAAVSGAKATTNSAQYGFGGRYHFDKNLAMRVEYTRYASDTGVFSAGVQYAF
jgi:OmpA-OmpF porin, OOP family